MEDSILDRIGLSRKIAERTRLKLTSPSDSRLETEALFRDPEGVFFVYRYDAHGVPAGIVRDGMTKDEAGDWAADSI